MTTYNKNITVDTLKFLKEKFEQVDGKDFKLHYVKMVLPANTTEASRKKIWSVLWGDDQSHRWPEYTQYPLFELAEDTEPSHIVYGALVGTNVAEGWFAIESLMKEAVKRLLLRNYEPESMPDSNTFLDNFWRFADTLEEYEIPIQHQAGEVYLWFEFLFKLSKEQRSFITADYLLSCLYMKELPCVPKIQGLKTDALKASILALDYLLSKAEQKYQPAEMQQNQQAKTLSEIEPVGQIANNLREWVKKQRDKKSCIREGSSEAARRLRDSIIEAAKGINAVLDELRWNEKSDMAEAIENKYKEVLHTLDVPKEIKQLFFCKFFLALRQSHRSPRPYSSTFYLFPILHSVPLELH